MSGRDKVATNFDRPLVLIYLALMFMGWANIYSAAYDPEHANIFDQSREYGKQGVWMGISLLIGAATLLVRGHTFRDAAYMIYSMVLLLLVAVLLFGKVVNGAKAWFAIGGFGIQPAEFAKFATALALSRYLSGLKALVDVRSRVMSSIIILIPVALIMLQPDTGTALVSGAFILVLYREGLSGNVLLIAIMAAILSVLALIMQESSYGLPFTDKELGGEFFLMILIAVFAVISWVIVRNMVLKRLRKRMYGYLGLSGIHRHGGSTGGPHGTPPADAYPYSAGSRGGSTGLWLQREAEPDRDRFRRLRRQGLLARNAHQVQVRAHAEHRLHLLHGG